MVKYALFIGADLRGPTHLQPSGGRDDPHFTYLLKVLIWHHLGVFDFQSSRLRHLIFADLSQVRCESCGEERDKDIGLRLGEMIRLKSHLFHAPDFLSAHLDRRRAHVLLKVVPTSSAASSDCPPLPPTHTHNPTHLRTQRYANDGYSMI